MNSLKLVGMFARAHHAEFSLIPAAFQVCTAGPCSAACIWLNWRCLDIGLSMAHDYAIRSLISIARLEIVKYVK